MARWAGVDVDADDIDALKAEVVSRHRQLDAIDVAECAENVVRTAYEDHLACDINHAQSQLDAAVDLVNHARGSGDVMAILDSEQGFVTIKRWVHALQVRRDRLSEDIARAETAYEATRQLAIQRIQQCQAMLDNWADYR